MICNIDGEANRMVDNLAKGNLGAIAEHYVFPIVIYWADGVLVLKDRETFLRMLSAYRAKLLDKGLSLVSSSVVKRPKPTAKRGTAEVANTYFNVCGEIIGSARIRYFLQSEGRCPKIRMVEYLESPIEAEEVQALVH